MHEDFIERKRGVGKEQKQNIWLVKFYKPFLNPLLFGLFRTETSRYYTLLRAQKVITTYGIYNTLYSHLHCSICQGSPVEKTH